MIDEERRFTSEGIIISPVEEKDVFSIAEGYYACFGPEWHDVMEPPDRAPSHEVRVERMAKRTKIMMKSPDARWMKATLAEEPDKVIGHAGWLVPSSIRVMHHWRRDAAERLGWREKEGWTKEEEDKLWSHVDLEHWQAHFVGMDDIRAELMRGFWRQFWVLPEYQKRGISTLLMKDVLDIGDAQDPPIPVFLEAVPTARRVYEHMGFEGVEGKELQMIRRGPKKSQS